MQTASGRPTEMRIEVARCTECGACLDLAPVIANDPQRIPISPVTLDAMAECPTGAIVWREAGLSGRKTEDPHRPPRESGPSGGATRATEAAVRARPPEESSRPSAETDD